MKSWIVGASACAALIAVGGGISYAVLGDPAKANAVANLNSPSAPTRFAYCGGVLLGYTENLQAVAQVQPGAAKMLDTLVQSGSYFMSRFKKVREANTLPPERWAALHDAGHERVTSIITKDGREAVLNDDDLRWEVSSCLTLDERIVVKFAYKR